MSKWSHFKLRPVGPELKWSARSYVWYLLLTDFDMFSFWCCNLRFVFYVTIITMAMTSFIYNVGIWARASTDIIYKLSRITSGHSSGHNLLKIGSFRHISKGRSEKTTLQNIIEDKLLHYQFDSSIRHPNIKWLFVANSSKTSRAEQGIIVGSGMAYNLSRQINFFV